MSKASTTGISLLIVGAAFVALATPAEATHGASASVDRSTIYETGSSRQFVSANFTGSYATHDDESIVSGSETWVWPDDGTTSSGTRVMRSFKDAGTWVVQFKVLVTKAGNNEFRTATVPITVVNPPPTTTHTNQTITSGQPLDIRFDILDNQGVSTATLFYRHSGETTFLSQTMTKGGGAPGGAERWTYQIPAAYLTAPVEYYAQATDISKVPKTATFRPSATTYYLAGGGAGDNQPPTITLTLAGTKVVPYGSGYAIVIGLSDPSGITTATFSYKKTSDSTWTNAAINLTTKSVVIPWATSVAGVYNWHISATDGNSNNGNLNTQGSPGTFTLSVGPKIVVTPITGVQKLTPGGQVAVAGTLTDDKTGATATLAYNTGAGWASAAMTAGSESGTGAILKTITGNIPMPAGQFGARDIWFYVNATDAPDGNQVSSGLLKVVVSTDVTKPTISGETPTGPVKAVAAIGATTTDEHSGVDVATLVVKLDGTVVPAAQVTATATGFTIAGTSAVVTALTEGSHTVNATTSDKDGNVGTKQWTFVLDKTAPTISNEGPTGLKNALGSVEATVADGGSGVDVASAKIDGNAAVATIASGKATIAAPALGDGAHTVSLTVTDKAGNAATKNWTFTLDTTAPTITSAGLDATSTTGLPAITVTFSDGTGSGVKAGSATLKIDGVTQAITATATGFSFTPTTAMTTGSHTAVVTVEDNAGNAATHTKTFQVAIPVPPAAPPAKKGFFGLPGFEAVFALAALGAAMLVLRRRS